MLLLIKRLRIDFRTFFEWFRNQEDYENECKVQNADLQFTDKALDSVKKAMLAMLDGCTNLRVARKPRLEMKVKVDKNGVGLKFHNYWMVKNVQWHYSVILQGGLRQRIQI